LDTRASRRVRQGLGALLSGFGYRAGDGRTIDYGSYHEIGVQAYGEIGLIRGLAATLHLPIVRGFTLEDPPTGTTSGHVAAGDPAVGLRWRFLARGRLVAAVEATARAPVAPSEPVQRVYAAAAGNPIVNKLHVGTGVWDHAGAASFGYGWDRAYLAASAGYVHRTGGFDGVVTERWSARLRLVGWHALDNGAALRAESPSGVGSGVAYTAFAVEADYRFAGAWVVGTTLEGGLAGVRRQTGGPVISAYFAVTF
jgi:hypothetical protein